MSRQDRALPPVPRVGTVYDTQYREDYHKEIFKYFLKMRSKITDAYDTDATRQVLDGSVFYKYFDIKNKLGEGTVQRECLENHGMSEESIQEIIDFNNSEDLDYLRLNWKGRIPLNQEFFDSIRPEFAYIFSQTFTVVGTDADTGEPSVFECNIVLSERREAIVVLLASLYAINWSGSGSSVTGSPDESKISSIISDNANGEELVGDIAGINYAMSVLNEVVGDIYHTETSYLNDTTNQLGSYVSNIGSSEVLLNKLNFEKISQDNFFDVYSKDLFIDYRVDQSFLEKFFGGLIKAIGSLLVTVLDFILDLPIIGDILELVIEGIVSIFGMSLDQAKSLLIKIIITALVTYLTWGTGTTTVYGFLDKISSAYTLGSLAGKSMEAVYLQEAQTDQEIEAEEEAERALEREKLDLTLAIGINEPILWQNQPEEELRIYDGYEYEYRAFKLD